MLLIDEQGMVYDTLGWRATGQTTFSITMEARSRDAPGRSMSLGHPFDRRSLLAYDPLGRWMYVGAWRFSDQGESLLEIRQISATGEVLASMQLPFARSAASEDDLRRFAKRVHDTLPESIGAQVSAADVARALRGQVPRPSTTMVDAMIASELGVMWFRQTAGPQRTGPAYWAAYEPNKGFRGVAAFAAGEEFMAAGGGRLWSVSYDSLGLPTIRGWVPVW